jgi:hypothetical protein
MVNIDELFTTKGALTIEKRQQFAGRDDILVKCLDSLSQDGAGVVVFGERGAGKTSLAWQLVGSLTGSGDIVRERGLKTKTLQDKSYNCIWCTCSELMHNIGDLVFTLMTDSEGQFNLRSVYPKVFTDQKTVEKVTRKYEIGIAPVAKGTFTFAPSEKSAPSVAPSNADLAAFSMLKELLDKARREYPQKGLVVFLDEFDQLDERVKIGILLKGINNVRFVIVGIGASRKALIGHHPSVARKLTSYELPLLSVDDINWFFDSVQRRSSNALLFTREFRTLIVAKSSGFPWLVQQLGYASAQDAIAQVRSSAARTTVDRQNYENIIRDFIVEKLGKDEFDIASIDDAQKRILAGLADASKGRLSENDLLSKLPPGLTGFYERSIGDLSAAGVVYEHQREIRIVDPLTKILVDLAREQGYLKY